MVKFLLTLLFIFLMFSQPCSAKDPDIKLKIEFGQDLTHAPFFLRFAFQEKYGKDWKESDYAERESFLNEYEINLAKEQVQDKADARAEADEEKERLDEKREELRKTRDRLKAQLDEEKAEISANNERQKEFDQSIKAEEKELQDMDREITEERDDAR